MRSEITIIDYGAGNLFNAVTAFKACGVQVNLADDPETLINADRLVFPGVGSFPNAISELKNLNLFEAIKIFISKGNPFLGICLGMQMMMDVSEEINTTMGLSLIPGQVISVPKNKMDGQPHKIPHIGWNEIIRPPNQTWDKTLLRGIPKNAPFYFLHSFMVVPENEKHLIAYCDYDGHPISAVIHKENMFGCQFHPEKSGKLGLKVLENFLFL